MASFNQLSDEGQIERDDGESIPCEPIVVGDMQGVKSIMGMSECCHSVWCKCKARGGFEGEGPQHQYGEPGSQFSSYEEMLEFYDRIGCEFKTEDFLLACAHLSKGLFYGGKFTPLHVPRLWVLAHGGACEGRLGALQITVRRRAEARAPAACTAGCSLAC